MLVKSLAYAAILFLLSATVTSTSAQVKLPSLLRDSMVLQRDQPIHIWGWAAPGEKITLQFNNSRINTAAASTGKWAASLPATKAGGPYTLQIDASNHLLLKDILVGDVWICAGQSNMVLPMERVKYKYADEIKQAHNASIRQFFVPTLPELRSPKEDLPPGRWGAATGASLLNFSAVAYFFAKEIYEHQHIPIGLINTSVGGAPAESFTSEEGLQSFKNLLHTVQQNKDTAFINTHLRAVAAYEQRRSKPNDKGLNGAIKWYDPGYTAKGWHTITIPGYWEDQGVRDLDGIVWYRKEINVPASMTGMSARISMGRIVDADYMYVNGQLVGNTTYQYPPRNYTIPAGLLKPGKNLLVMRIINYNGKGGFVPDKHYFLQVGEQKLDLAGEWLYKVGDVFLLQKDAVVPMTMQYQPTALYNGMIAPLVGYTIKGFLWYQGEANTFRPVEYASLLPSMIRDWRSRWKQGELPFIYAQLPNFMDVSYLPSESQWATLRESQLKTLSVPHTGMAVTIDLGEWNDIHPLNKSEVGRRLALVARHDVYGEKELVYSGPLYASDNIIGNKIIIHFNHTGSGLTTSDGEAPNRFAIAGADKKFVWAQAHIEDNTVAVWNDAIPQPLYVRYAWADNPDGANLYNKEGLPASPFRTDDTVATAKAGLKDYYRDYFPIGVAVSPRALKTDEAGLILQQFNSLTPENAMKMGPIHPKQNEYYWKDADSIVDFAQRNQLKVRGHNLCWHNQTPSWLFTGKDGQRVTKEVLLQRLKEHITTVVNRYKGKIYAWDVVNEAISDEPGEYLRNSEWLQICGEEYIAKAFQYAHEADPDALLFYNDYNEISAVKREKIYRLVNSLKEAGVPIHGVGLQGHWAVNEPSEAQLDSTLQRFASLGLKMQITELDISVYNKEHHAREGMSSDNDTAFSAAKEARQMEVYNMSFRLFRKYHSQLSGVTFWNISDRHSWLDGFPVRNRKDHPLLFNQNLHPKKAYWEVVNF